MPKTNKHGSGRNVSYFYKGHVEDSKPTEFAAPVTFRWVLLATMLGKGFLTWGSWTGLSMRIWKSCPFHIAKLKAHVCTAKGAQFPAQMFGILISVYALSPVILMRVKQFMLASGAVAQNTYIPADCAIVLWIAALEGSSLLTTGAERQGDKSRTEAHSCGRARLSLSSNTHPLGHAATTGAWKTSHLDDF